MARRIDDRQRPFLDFAKSPGFSEGVGEARKLVRRYPWFLKLDVRKCFELLDPSVVLETFARVIDRGTHGVLDCRQRLETACFACSCSSLKNVEPTMTRTAG